MSVPNFMANNLTAVKKQKCQPVFMLEEKSGDH